MDNPVEFRRAMRGYNKEDVNDFISQENIRFNKLEESYIKKIKDLEQEMDELKEKMTESDATADQIIALELDVSRLNGELGAKDSIIAEKDSVIEGLKTAADNANEKLNEANKLIDDLKAKAQAVPKVEQITSPNRYYSPAIQYDTPDYDPEIIEKAEKYDTICDKVDEILAFAKEEADKIIEEAFEIRRSALSKRETYDPKKDILSKSDSIMDDLKRSIKRRMKGSK